MEQLKTNIESADIALADAVFEDIAAVRKEYPLPY